MWVRFAESLRCPLCRGGVELLSVERRTAKPSREHLERGERFGHSAERLTAAVDTGLLVCRSCKVWYPVLHGLPIMLPYSTPLRREFLASHAGAVEKLGEGYGSPRETPPRGEEFVLRSFSREWLEYDYDGTLWIWSYEDREKMFLAEMGTAPPVPRPARYLEIGCGLGLVTSFAAKNFPGDAIGVDLSLAAMRAALHFKDHPFLHFVQSSVFSIPLERASCDLVYTHGVIHCTYSTEAAFKALAPFCKPGGRTYIWIYGPKTNTENLGRRLAYGVEVVLRPILSRVPPGVANIVLKPIAVGYMGINWMQRTTGDPRGAFNFTRALHMARDRLTPLFMYRHEDDEVLDWFKDYGFQDLHVIHEEEVPPAAKSLIRRNVGVRGVLPAASGGNGGS